MTCERTVSVSQESERPVATDVFLHNLEPFTQEALRRAVEQGLTPSGLDFAGVLLLWGGEKRKQSSDIERALEYLKDYKERAARHET